MNEEESGCGRGAGKRGGESKQQTVNSKQQNPRRKTFACPHYLFPLFPFRYPSMISKLETISAVGRSVAATLQYFSSESAIAWATDRSETLRPVTI